MSSTASPSLTGGAVELTPSESVHPAFSSPNADLVLHSKDGIIFRVPSDLLRTTSGWFRSTLTLPQGPPSADGSATPIPMDEEASVLADLLTIVSGAELPALDDLDHVELLLRAADKYEMALPISIIRLALVSPLIACPPLRLYRIACTMGWEREAQRAVTDTFAFDLLAPENLPELHLLDPVYFTRLLALHRRRRLALIEALGDMDAFYANRPPPGSRCTNPTCLADISHASWHVFKIALLKKIESVPPLAETWMRVDGGVLEIGDLENMCTARCGACGKTLYAMKETMVKIAGILNSLPAEVEWS